MGHGDDFVFEPEGNDSDTLVFEDDLQVADLEAADKAVGEYGTIDTLQTQNQPVLGNEIPPVEVPAPPVEEEVEIASDVTDYAEKAKTTLERYFTAFEESPDNIKSKDDYTVAQDRMAFLNHYSVNDPLISQATQLAELPDDNVLTHRLIQQYGELEDDEEIEARKAKFYNPEGQLTDKGKTIVENTRQSLLEQARNRFFEIRTQANGWAAQQQEYRKNIESYVPAFVPPKPTFEVGNAKVEIEEITLPKLQKQQLQQFISSGQYEEAVGGKAITAEGGYKTKVENAFWVNPSVRDAYLSQLAKSAYEKGQSDYAAKHIIK